MRKQTAFVSAAVLLLCGRDHGVGGGGRDAASDTVILSAAQRRAAWNDLKKQATNQNAAGFDATIGAFVPNTVKIEPMPSKTAADVPSLRPYGFAMVGHKLVIVDPSSKVIADALTK